MRVYDQEAFVRVTADHYDVSEFARTWPCSGFVSYDRVSATFDARNGDLVDVQVNGRDVPDRIEGTGALGALLEDMQNFAAVKLENGNLSRS